MKFLHTADLHIGKKVNEFSMAEEQRHVLGQILDMVRQHRPDGLLIAGDVYDKNIPGVEGVAMLDWFLTSLAAEGCAVFMVSGNHDSGERLAFASQLLKENRIYVAGAGRMERITLEDEYGPLNLYLMPFLRPSQIRELDGEGGTCQKAVETVIGQSGVDAARRNLLICHQFVTNGGAQPERSDSEQLSLGSLEEVDVSVFDAFDYVALGHLHGPQRVGRDTVRYAGSPLKYSFSECRQKKSVTMVTVKEKGCVETAQLPLFPLHDMREIRGPLKALIREETYRQADVQDYIHATLTDEEELYDAIGQLRAVYPNLMKLDFDNSRSRPGETARNAACQVARKGPMELFREFYESQNNGPMSQEQEGLMTEILKETEGMQ